MRFDPIDPAYLAIDRARGNLRLAVRLALCFVALLWGLQLLNGLLDVSPADFGVRPREAAGLLGIVTAPLVHADFPHLFANSAPLFVAGTALLYLYPQSSPRVLPLIYLGPGIAVWLFGRSSSHIGASGLVYGMVAYVFFAGMIRRDRRAIAASLLVCFLYGAMWWGVLPIERGMSWETHLAAALIGVVLAVLLRRRDVPPRKRYEPDDDVHDEGDDDGAQRDPQV